MSAVAEYPAGVAMTPSLGLCSQQPVFVPLNPILLAADVDMPLAGQG